MNDIFLGIKGGDMVSVDRSRIGMNHRLRTINMSPRSETRRIWHELEETYDLWADECEAQDAYYWFNDADVLWGIIHEDHWTQSLHGAESDWTAAKWQSQS